MLEAWLAWFEPLMHARIIGCASCVKHARNTPDSLKFFMERAGRMFRRVVNVTQVPPPATPAPNVAGEEGGLSRPKFSRRPANFTSELHSQTTISDRMHPMPTMPVPRWEGVAPWQEDVRFGIVLVLLLLAFNVLLIAFMPSLPTFSERSLPMESSAQLGSMPVQVPTTIPGSPAVTFYAQPEQNKSDYKPHDLPYEDSTQNSLSISPQDFPAPVARPLESASPSSTGRSVDAQ